MAENERVAVDTMTPEQKRDYYTLPEQRIRIDVGFGGISAFHVIEYRTDPAWSHMGRWTRRSASRRTFCGSLSATLVGIDATDWPKARVAPDLSRVTCARCLARAERIFPLTQPRSGGAAMTKEAGDE